MRGDGHLVEESAARERGTCEATGGLLEDNAWERLAGVTAQVNVEWCTSAFPCGCPAERVAPGVQTRCGANRRVLARCDATRCGIARRSLSAGCVAVRWRHGGRCRRLVGSARADRR